MYSAPKYPYPEKGKSQCLPQWQWQYYVDSDALEKQKYQSVSYTFRIFDFFKNIYFEWSNFKGA